MQAEIGNILRGTDISIQFAAHYLYFKYFLKKIDTSTI